MAVARWLPASASADARLLLITRALRGFADGAVSVILPSYLVTIGFDSFAIGVIVFGTLFGSAALTLGVGLAGTRFAPRRVLIAASALMFLTGIGFFSVAAFWPLFLIAVVGTMNPSAGDVSLFLPAEQTALAVAVAIGSLASGLPTLIAGHAGWPIAAAERGVFLVYALVALIVAAFYRRMRAPAITHQSRPPAPLTKSRRIVIQLSMLFSLDSFGGGFVVQS